MYVKRRGVHRVPMHVAVAEVTLFERHYRAANRNEKAAACFMESGSLVTSISTDP